MWRWIRIRIKEWWYHHPAFFIYKYALKTSPCYYYWTFFILKGLYTNAGFYKIPLFPIRTTWLYCISPGFAHTYKTIQLVLLITVEIKRSFSSYDDLFVTHSEPRCSCSHSLSLLVQLENRICHMYSMLTNPIYFRKKITLIKTCSGLASLKMNGCRITV